jgi:hypothetical protein
LAQKIRREHLVLFVANLAFGWIEPYVQGTGGSSTDEANLCHAVYTYPNTNGATAEDHAEEAGRDHVGEEELCS